MTMETVDAILASGTPLQKDSPSDWVKVCRAEGHPDFDWKPSGNSIQFFAVSTRDGLPSPQASLPLSEAPQRSSMVYDEAAGIVRTSHMPPKVLCAIVVLLRQELHVYQIPLHLDDRDEQTFDDEIMRRVQSYVKTQSPADRRTYIRAGRVRLLALSENKLNERATSSVEKGVEWDRHVTKMIADYCSKDDDHEEPIPFILEVRMEFEWLTIDKTKTSLDRGIRQVLIDHRLTNMHREEFWSKKLLKALFTKSTVNQLLTEDSTWKQEATKSQVGEHQIEAEQEAFLGYIMADRTRLLAAMMRTRVEIACLYRLWKSGYKQYDNDPLDDGTFGNVLDHWEAGDLCKNMASFNPITFTRPYDKREPLRHKRIGTEQVVPVLYDESNGKCKEIGKGSFGTVYRVKVQGDYHGFSADKDECYALKCLNRKLESTLEVDGEAGVLEMLALRPHEHITPLYASWTREGLTYILLPKADMSLQEFFRREPSPDLADQNKVIWLFTQLRGLAAAVGHIHHIGFNETNSTPAAAMEARKRKLHMGYHHDLKPGNVLVFGDCLKVSDFGAAKIHQLVSGKSTVNTPFTQNSPYGDETYGGPDRLVNSPATVGQPYDVWSLGCIYLEILLWATGYGRQLQDFAHQRMGKPSKCHRQCNGPQSHGGATMMTKSDKTRNEESTTEDEDGVIKDVMENDSYWYQCEKGSCHLKPCVDEWLRKVKTSHCAGNDLFLRLYQEIRKMLKIKPADRVSAGVVKDNIGNLLYQAEVNFIRHDLTDFGWEMHIGGFESDNTTYADFASNSMPVPGMQRSRSDTLEPPSPQRSPTGRIPGEEAIRDAGSRFESFSVERAQESGTDIDINIRQPSTRRRNTTRSSHSKQPAFLLIKPNGNTEPIDHMDETPRHRTRRHRSLDSSGSFKFVERTHGGNNVFHNSVQTTHLELSKHVLENERIICDTPQEQSRTAQKSQTDDQSNLPNDGTSPGARPEQDVPSGGRRDLERVNSLELYYKISGEAIRRLNAEDSGELAEHL